MMCRLNSLMESAITDRHIKVKKKKRGLKRSRIVYSRIRNWDAIFFRLINICTTTVLCICIW